MKRWVFVLVAPVLLFFVSVAYAGNFSDNGNGTVTDNNTSLMWQKEDDNTTRTWERAISYCEGLSLAGYTDWRLPNINELRSIVDNTKSNPAIDTTYFPNTDASHYWSSTRYTYGTAGTAWYVPFGSGFFGYDGDIKSGSHYVRCVRGQ